jgi:hypothetical protein
MIWTGCVSCVGAINGCREESESEDLSERNFLKDLGINGRIVLR